METCPHYLNFAAEDVPEGATDYKCAPPLRLRANQERLWQFVMDGRIDSIGTDHSPSPPEMKHLEEGDFSKAWGGISGAQTPYTDFLCSSTHFQFTTVAYPFSIS